MTHVRKWRMSRNDSHGKVSITWRISIYSKVKEKKWGSIRNIYPMPWHENDALDKFLQQQRESNYIHPSKSPYATPLFFVAKKDGDVQPVQDYQVLNSYTVKNYHPLPLISKLIDRVAKALLFSKVDVWKGFNNIRTKEGDEWKATFKISVWKSGPVRLLGPHGC